MNKNEIFENDNKKNCGKTEVQIYYLTLRINSINEHIKQNPHDNAGKRGIACLIGKRNRLCKYFKKCHGQVQYQAVIIDTIGLRK